MSGAKIVTVESPFFEPPRETETSSKNRRWHEITLDLRWYCFIKTRKANRNTMTLLYGFSFHLKGHTLGVYSSLKR